MKKLLALALIFMLLAGCGASPEAPDAAEDTPPPQTEETVPVTEETLRALYESEGKVVLDIVPRDGDFLVWYGCNDSPAVLTSGPEDRYGDASSFDWVYTEEGIRCCLVTCSSDVATYEILSSGAVKVIPGDQSIITPTRSFPKVLYAYSSPRKTDHGPLPYGDDITCSEWPYWAPLSEPHAVGQKRREVLVDARLGTDCLELVFGPPADLDGLLNFYAACSTLPLVETSYDKAARQLTLTCRKTALTSGEIAVYEDPEVQKCYEDWIADRDLPTSFPAGALPDTNLFIERAEVRADGEDTLVILTLAENVVSYNITGSYLLPDGSPWLRLSLQADFD